MLHTSHDITQMKIIEENGLTETSQNWCPLHKQPLEYLPCNSTQALKHTRDCSSHTRDECRWLGSTVVDDHAMTLTSTPSNNQTPLFLPSFNPHLTNPGLRPQRDSPHPSLLRLCGCHAVRCFTDRCPLFWLWLIETTEMGRLRIRRILKLSHSTRTRHLHVKHKESETSTPSNDQHLLFNSHQFPLPLLHNDRPHLSPSLQRQ